MAVDWIDTAIKTASTMLAATWGVYFKAWLEKPNTTSEQNDETNKAHQSRWKSWFLNLCRSPWIGVVNIVLGIVSIVLDYQKSSEVTKGFVLRIGLDILFIVYGIIVVISLTLFKITRELIRISAIHHEGIGLLSTAHREKDESNEISN